MGMGGGGGKYDGGAGDAARYQEEAARRAAERYAQEAEKAIGDATQAEERGRSDLDKYYGDQQGYMNPYLQGGNAGLSAFLGGLGFGGNGVINSVLEQFRNSPGYKAAFDEGQKAVERSNAARGMSHSGALEKRLTRYGQDYADQQYGKFMDRLGGLAGIGMSAGQFLGNNAMNMGSQLANMGQNYAGMKGNWRTGIGQVFGDSEIAQGNARAQGAMSQGNPFAGVGQAVSGFLGGGGGGKFG